MAGGSIDGEGADGSLLGLTDAIGLVGGIDMRARRVHDQATRAVPQRVNPGGRQRPGLAVHFKQMNAAAVAGGEIHLGRQGVAKGGAEGSDIGHERAGGLGRPRLRAPLGHRRGRHHRGGGFQKRSARGINVDHGDVLSGMKLKEKHADRRIIASRDRFESDDENQGRIRRDRPVGSASIPLGRRNHDHSRLTDLHARRSDIEAGNHLPRARGEAQGSAAMRGRIVEHFPGFRQIAGVDEVRGLPGLE